MNALTFAVEDGIAVIAFDAEESWTNLLANLAPAVERVLTDTALKGAILTSGRCRPFISSSNARELAARCEAGITAQQGRDLARDLQNLVRRVETGGKPFVAALKHGALDTVFELALGCHHRVLATDAAVGLTHAKHGLMPAAGGTQRLPRLLGVAPAVSLIINGNVVSAAEALRLGIVHALAPADELIATARQWLRTAPEAMQPWDRKGFVVPGGTGPLAAGATQTFMVGTAAVRKQTQGHLPAPRAILAATYEGTIAGFEAGLAIEAKYFGHLIAQPVTRNLLRTLVNTERAKRLHARPSHVPAAPVRKLGVLGAGMMGSGIAYVAADAGMRVVLLDTTAEAADRGKAHAQQLLAKQIERGAMTQTDAQTVLARIQTTTDYAALDGCDAVIEAVFENRAIKQEVMQRVEAVIGPEVLLASNTSTLPITGLATALERPARFIGLHFFSPVDRMPLLEIIRGRETSDTAVAHALDLAAQLSKTPILVNDSPGFYTTRVFSTFIDEGICMLAEGIEPALIENAARLAGMPVGPLAQFDEVSLELSWNIIVQARADGLPERFIRAAAAPFIERMLQLGRRGRRQGGGFYEYPPGGKKYLWSALREHFQPASTQPPVEQLQTRLLTIQALEAARCVEEGVITDAADADLGALLGIGYPQWTGGPLSYIDTIGGAAFVAACERFAAAHGARYAPSPWLKARAASGQRFHPQPRAALAS